VGGVVVTSRRIEQLGWTDRGTAEMKSERCDVQESVYASGYNITYLSLSLRLFL